MSIICLSIYDLYMSVLLRMDIFIVEKVEIYKTIINFNMHFSKLYAV